MRTLKYGGTELKAYVDGSFNATYRVYGSGVIIINNNKEEEFSHANNNPDLIPLRNIAGEIEASKFVMWYAYSNNIPEVTIYHDYIGISNWPKGTWQAKKDYTKEYVRFYKQTSTKVKINFVKVKAHSGDKYNERVDKLAKKAISEFIN